MLCFYFKIKVTIKVNDEKTDVQMKLSSSGEAFFIQEFSPKVQVI